MENISSSVEFEIVSKIAEGGQGAVYKAVQKGVEGFEKTVAIKTMHKGFASEQTFIDMFISEAKLVANLVHENIVQIYQLGRQGDFYYFVLEFINGISLFDFLNFHQGVKQPIPRELAVYITSRIARGLAYAHSRKASDTDKPLNIVHCDVCPHNILINTEGLPKITDFGIAKAATIINNQTGISGKLPFMSPEQAEMKELDFRSDIYSLGCVLFNMLAGNTSRNLNTDIDHIIKQARNNLICWDRLPQDIDQDLFDIVNKMLQKDRDQRYQSTDELAKCLEYYIYKDGYGPTIVTLAEYMREQMPGLFETTDHIPYSERRTEFIQTTLLQDI